MGNQLIKKSPATGYLNLYPNTFTDAVVDRLTEKPLDEILAGFNMLFLPYLGGKTETRLQVPLTSRRNGMWVCYVEYDGTVHTEYYNNPVTFDIEWEKDINWVAYSGGGDNFWIDV